MALTDFFNGPKLRRESEQHLDEIKRLTAESTRLTEQYERLKELAKKLGVMDLQQVQTLIENERTTLEQIRSNCEVYAQGLGMANLQAHEPLPDSRMPNSGMLVPNMGMAKRARPRPLEKARSASLAGALFSGTQQRVLAWLFGQPERSFYATELIGLAGAGSGAVQRELARLAQSGLVTARAVGNQKHYQANPGAPIYAELCGIVQKTVGLAEPLRDALAPLAGRILAAFVYGSIAKREDTATSDIDLMLISEDDLAYADLYAALEAVSNRLSRTVNPTIYTPQELAQRVKRKDAFATRVLAQPKIWLIGGEDALGI